MEATDRWQQVEDIFHAALERDTGERAAFLDTACGSDGELRAEVESLIAAHEAPGDFIDTPAYRITNSLFSGAKGEPREGRTIAHYNIVGQLGRGGMGEVYLAEDTQLGRKVALKFLPSSVTGDLSRLRRFEQEARAASALNHPNIVTIYEIGEAEGSHYISTELIEGDTLRRKLVRGEVKLRDAIEITIQLTSALAAAHQSGIVHRDIKPENIMIRPDGYVKILDFGLAKLAEQREESGGDTVRRIVRVDTEPGVVMGTLSYMSPEQARGRAVDGRSDIFSLGVVLYEMIAEKSPFEGDTPSDVIASILKVEPVPLSKFSSDLPAELQRIVTLALQKEKSKRYQSADEMLTDLKNLRQDMEFEAKLSRTGGFMSNLLIRGSRRGLTPYMALIGLGLIIAAGTLIWWLLARSSNSESGLPLSLNPVRIADWKSAPGERTVRGAISPDGKFVAFSSNKDGNSNIWVKQISGGDPYEVTEGEGGDASPVWSPDGDQLAFVSNRGGQNGIWTIPSQGRSSPKLVKSMEANLWPQLIKWSRDGEVIYYQLSVNVYSFNLRTEETNQLTNFDAVSSKPYDFTISADESRIAYIENKKEQADIYVLSRQSGQSIQITNDKEEDRNPLWLPDGKRIAYNSDRNGVYQICVIRLGDSNPAPITFGDSDLWISDVSIDGSKILYTGSKEDCDIWGVSIADGEEEEITSADGVELWPDVSQDGQAIIYQSVKEPSDGRRIFQSSLNIQRFDNSDERRLLVPNGFDPQWSPDGKRVAFLRSSGNKADMWVMKVVGGQEQKLTNGDVEISFFSHLPYNRTQVKDYSWSPANDRIAYCSSESNTLNIYTMAADGSGRTKVSNNTDSGLRLYCPLWSPDGTRLAYTSSPTSPSDTSRDFGVWVAGSGEATNIYQAKSFLRIIGWNQSGDEIIACEDERKKWVYPPPDDLSLVRISPRKEGKQLIAHLKSTYFYNIRPSTDGRFIAYVSREDGRDNIYVIPVTGGRARKVTSNNDPRLFFSGMTWSPDGKTIYYGRQTRRNLLSLFENFK